MFTVVFVPSVRAASEKFQLVFSTSLSATGLATFALLMSFGVVANGLCFEGRQPNCFLLFGEAIQTWRCTARTGHHCLIAHIVVYGHAITFGSQRLMSLRG